MSAIGYSYINANPGDTITQGFFKFDDNTNPTSITIANEDCNATAFMPISANFTYTLDPTDKIILDIYTSFNIFVSSFFINLGSESSTDVYTTYSIDDHILSNNPII